MSSADVVIIGGGIMGTSAAFYLAQRGLRVTLAEKRFIAAGATGKSTAIIRQHYSNEITARMALWSLRVFQNFEEQVGGGDAGYVKTGFAVLVGASDRRALDENIAMQQRIGINTRIISADEMRELNPDIDLSDGVLSAYEPEGGYADPAYASNLFAEAAKKRGAEILQETQVTKIEMQNGRISGVETTRGKISTPAVVNCANAWAADIARMAGVTLPIQPARVQVATFQRPPSHKESHLTAGDFVNLIYFRPEGHLTFAGLIDPEEANNTANPDHYNESADYEFIEGIAARICKRFPYMKQALVKGGWTGIYDITPDWHPVIDEFPEQSGFFTAAGFSGHGFKLGPAVGTMIADMVTHATCPTDQLERGLFRYSRFAENQPVHGKYEYSIIG